jgi:hypothetical protein
VRGLLVDHFLQRRLCFASRWPGRFVGTEGAEFENGKDEKKADG